VLALTFCCRCVFREEGRRRAVAGGTEVGGRMADRASGFRFVGVAFARSLRRFAGTPLADDPAKRDNRRVHAVVRRRPQAADVASAAAAAVVSVLLFDLFPGPAALLALSAGGAGWLLARRGSLAGRWLVGAFAGMVLAAAVIVVLALVAQ